MKSFCQATGVLPPGLRAAALALPEEWRVRGEELRLRLGRSMTVLLDGTERDVPGTPPVSPYDLGGVLEIAPQASAHTALERVRRGFVTVRGGHRIGLCGTAAVEEGQVISSSMAFTPFCLSVRTYLRCAGRGKSSRRAGKFVFPECLLKIHNRKNIPEGSAEPSGMFHFPPMWLSLLFSLL